MPFNQQMTVPVDLGFTPDGKALSADPAIELEALRVKPPVLDMSAGKGVKWTRDPTTKNLHALLADDLDAFDMTIRVRVEKSKSFIVDLRGTKVEYDEAKGTLTCRDVTAPVRLHDGVLDLRVLVDRGSIEVFADWGLTAMSVAAIPDEKNLKLELIQTGNEVTIQSVTLYRLKSAWEK